MPSINRLISISSLVCLARCLEIRRAGAASLDLAYVAAGRLDGFWELGLKEWDIAGGALLVQEAGGVGQRLCRRQ
jgi:fructose-1,6-bisphosphatase/inositol monophosphatase family enzyme